MINFIEHEHTGYALRTRQAVIKKLAELEASIPDFISKTKKTIEETRDHFFEILNPTDHPDFKIV